MGKKVNYESYPETGIISEVTDDEDYYSILVAGGMGFGLEKKFGAKPKVGDEITLYTYQGSAIRGITLNGKKVFYYSDKELEDQHKAWKAEYQRKKQEDFEKSKSKLDKIYDDLPEEFKQRIDKFRKDNPQFRVDYEAYELFCCQQAVLIANTLKTPEKVREFSECRDRWNMVPDLDKGHSGNTMGASTQLAYWYLQQPNAITRIAGSLSPLVGSKEYEEKNKRKKLSK